MSTILVVDDMAIFRDPIAATLRLAGYETLCAPNGKVALELMREKRPDLVLLDVAMPVMDGLTFLRHMRQDSKTSGVPVVLLTAVSEKQYVIEAGRLGVRDYLLKSRFSLQDLLDRVSKKLAAPASPASEGGAAQPSPAPERQPAPAQAGQASAARTPGKPAPDALMAVPTLMTREECIARAQTALEARTLSGVVAQVIAVAASPHGEMAQLAGLIAKDAVLSAKVLQVANSSAYATARGFVSNIPDAVRQVGCTVVRNIAAAVGIFDAMPESSVDGFNPIRCWQHSFAVAMLCEKLMAGDPDDAGIAYLVGLCHDLADILLHTHFAAEYRQVLDLQAKTGRTQQDLMRIMMGMSQNELMKTILGCLGLPENIRRPIESLHLRSEPSCQLGRVLQMADVYANGLLLASSSASPVTPLLKSSMKLIGADGEQCRPDNARLRAQVLGLTGMLARLPSTQSAELMSPLLPRHKVRLWVARDPAFSDFDPIAAALESMAEVQVQNRLPLENESGDLDGVVVIAKNSGRAGFGAMEIEQATVRQPIVQRDRLLWLVGEDDASLPQSSAPTATPFPVSLQQLANFVAHVAKTRSAAPAAAA